MDELERALRDHLATKQRLHDAIRKARARGDSFRTIAAKVGWSHEQVRRVVQGKAR